MKPKKRFTDDILAAIHKEKILGIRAGSEPHRVIGFFVRGADESLPFDIHGA